MSLESQQEEQWRLEDEGKLAPDPKKNFDEIVKTLTESGDVDLVKDEKKEQWTLSAKSAEDRIKMEEARKAAEEEKKKQEKASQASSTTAAPTPTPTVNADQNSYGEVKKASDGMSSPEQEKAALEEAQKADKSKWNARRRRV